MKRIQENANRFLEDCLLYSFSQKLSHKFKCT